MRILHSADWHLGKMFYGEYLTEEQAYVLTEQFLPMLKEENVDAVVLAGDVYDRSLPPAGAVELFDEIATKVTAELEVPFFVISGNHDSASRLSFGSRLLEKQNLYIAGELDKLSGPYILEDTYGPIAFIAAPFAEPASVRNHFGDHSIRDHETALARLLQQQSRGVEQTVRSVCIAHTFVAGGMGSDSERPLSIGGSDAVDAALFAPYTYTALGHLHGPQQAGSPSIRYAGSLLKYSFGEVRQKKGAVLVDIGKSGLVSTTFLPFEPRHDVRIIEGFFDDIMNKDDVRRDDFVLIRLLDTDPILDGMAKLRKKYPQVLALETPNRQSKSGSARSFDLRKSTEQQLFESFASAMQPDRPLTEAERACVNGLWRKLLTGEGEGLL